MAVRSVATSDTINTFRTTFNSLSSDLGDIASLNTTSSNIVGAINEVKTLTTSFYISDSASTRLEVTSNSELIFNTDSNLTAVVSEPDTVTISLASSLTGLSSITFGGVTATGFVDEDNMASNSASLIPTQQSVKAYVDTSISSVSLDIATLTGNTSQFQAALTDDDFAMLTNSVTLTNKTIDADNNTISNIGASEVKADLITGQTELSASAAANDVLLIYDTDATAIKKISVTNLGVGTTKGQIIALGSLLA